MTAGDGERWTPLVSQSDLSRTEESPAFEIHLGEVDSRRRFCIIWINGKRWQGYLEETPE